MSRYLLAPLESRIQDQVTFSVMTQTISPVFGTSESVCHGYITYIINPETGKGAWFAGREVAVAHQLPQMGYPHPDEAARSVIA